MKLHALDARLRWNGVGDADAGLLVDGLHPGSDGHRLMTQRIAARLERYAA